MKTTLHKLQLLFLVALLGVSSSMTAQLKCYVLKAPEKVIDGMKKLAIVDFKDRENQAYNYWYRDASRDYGSVLSDAMTANLMEEYRGVSIPKNNYLNIKTNVYTLVERSQIDAIMKEQKLGASGAVSEADAAEAGKLLGLDVILTGNYSTSSSVKTTSKQKTGTRADKTTYSYTEYSTVRTTVAESSMKIISVETGQVLAFTTKNFTRKSQAATAKSSADSRRTVESEEAGKSAAMKSLARVLTGYFVPSYQAENFNFDKPKNKEYKEEGKEAKKALKKGDLSTVYHILKKVHAEDPYEEAIAHDLAIVLEAVGRYEEAIKFHKQADQSGKKKYAKALDRCESGKKAIETLKALGITIEPYDFGEDTSGGTDVEFVKTKGNTKTRIPVYSDSNKGSTQVAKVPGGREFEVIERVGSNWVKIKLTIGDATEGYILASEVK